MSSLDEYNFFEVLEEKKQSCYVNRVWKITVKRDKEIEYQLTTFLAVKFGFFYSSETCSAEANKEDFFVDTPRDHHIIPESEISHKRTSPRDTEIRVIY